jgi:hypothetical protein
MANTPWRIPEVEAKSCGNETARSDGKNNRDRDFLPSNHAHKFGVWDNNSSGEFNRFTGLVHKEILEKCCAL